MRTSLKSDDVNPRALLLLGLLVGVAAAQQEQHLPPPGTGCDAVQVRAGTQTVHCDAVDTVSGHKIGYTLAVPAACVHGGCGIVLDVHGWTMSASIEDAQDEMRTKGNARGMIVVQPSAPRDNGVPSWKPLYHHSQLILFLRHTVALFGVDRSAVHVTGYSQGGFASWNILCLAPDLICSAAPLAASGLDSWGQGYGDQCFSAMGPTPPRAVLYTTGETDKLARFEFAQQQVANIKRIYNWQDEDATVIQGRDYTKSTWSTADMTFTYIDHKYDTATARGAQRTGGHCFPTATQDCCDGIHPCRRCCAEFTWSDVVLDFFEENRCAEARPMCTSLAEFSALVERINHECCDGPDEDCSSGYPSSCNKNCADVLLPMREACATYLSSQQMAPVKQLLDEAAAICPATPGSGH